MKKLVMFVSFVGLLGLFTACQKQAVMTVVETQTESVTLKMNGSYSFVLPVSAEGYTITTAAAHASVSLIGLDATKTQYVYQYTPMQDYVGTDVVVITSSESNAEPGCGNHATMPTSGMCGVGGDSLTHPGGHHGGHQGRHHGRHKRDVQKVIEITLNLAVLGDDNPKAIGYSQR